jgi:hypothetical protein
MTFATLSVKPSTKRLVTTVARQPAAALYTQSDEPQKNK